MKFLESSTNLTTGESGVAMGAVHVLEDHAIKFQILKEEDKASSYRLEKAWFSLDNWVKVRL